MPQITARLNHPDAAAFYKDCYCYDEPRIGLVAEPLVHITTSAIQAILQSKPEVITIFFSDDICDDHPCGPGAKEIWLERGESDADGTLYQAEAATLAYGLLGKHDVWLCNHLLDYFNEPPEMLYVTVVPHS